MPLYEYQCDGCGTRFERLVRAWGEEVLCPACHGGALTRLLSTFAVAVEGGPSRASAGGCGCARGGCGCGH